MLDLCNRLNNHFNEIVYSFMQLAGFKQLKYTNVVLYAGFGMHRDETNQNVSDES